MSGERTDSRGGIEIKSGSSRQAEEAGHVVARSRVTQTRAVAKSTPRISIVLGRKTREFGFFSSARSISFLSKSNFLVGNFLLCGRGDIVVGNLYVRCIGEKTRNEILFFFFNLFNSVYHKVYLKMLIQFQFQFLNS